MVLFVVKILNCMGQVIVLEDHLQVMGGDDYYRVVETLVSIVVGVRQDRRPEFRARILVKGVSNVH